MKYAATWVATVAAGYVLVLALVYAFQDRLIYFPTRELVTTPRDHGFDYEDVWLATEDGVRIHGWFIGAPGARATVLHLHGNGGNISHRMQRIALFRAIGLNVFVIDYRGYGRSAGNPSEEGTYRDAHAAWRHLTRTRGLAPAAIVVHGESLGGSVASWLAARETPRALVIESSFTSAPDLGAEAYPWLPVRRLSRYAYPTRANLARVAAPVLIVHSRDDEIVPFRHAVELYAAAREPKRLLELRGGHNDGFWVSRAAYIAGVEAFVRGVLDGTAEPESRSGRAPIDVELLGAQPGSGENATT